MFNKARTILPFHEFVACFFVKSDGKFEITQELKKLEMNEEISIEFLFFNSAQELYLASHMPCRCFKKIIYI